MNETRGFSRTQLDYQGITAVQSYRFLDSEVDYEERELNLLLRALQENVCQHREAFFLDVRQCRRRKQVSWEQTRIARLFTTPDEYYLLQHRAMIARIQSLLRSRGILAADAFRIFDSSRNGVLSCSELYGGLEWLGLELTPAQIYDLVNTLDSDRDGLVTQDEFVHAFHDAPASMIEFGYIYIWIVLFKNNEILQACHSYWGSGS
jgi:hypothetical protein